jgi:hypothetical protein
MGDNLAGNHIIPSESLRDPHRQFLDGFIITILGPEPYEFGGKFSILSPCNLVTQFHQPQ